MKNKMFIQKLHFNHARMSLVGYFLLLNAFTLSAQYPYVKTDSIVSYYQLRDDHTGLTEGYYFQGVFDEPVLSDGLIVKSIQWEKHFANPVTCSLDSAVLLLKLYCQNIDSVRLRINERMEKTVIPDENGYQLPYILKLKEWKNLPESNYIHIHDLSIMIYSQGKSTSKFVLGDVQIFKTTMINRNVVNPFFDEFYGTYSFDSIQENSFSSKSWPNLHVPFYYYLFSKLKNVKSEVIISPSDTAHKERFLYDFMIYALRKYPCYHEYQVDTAALFNRLNAWKELSYTSLTDSLISLVNGIGDPHFSLRKKADSKKRLEKKKLADHKYNPLRFIMLNKKISVAAVLNKNIEDIRVGDQLLSYNGREIQTTALIRSKDVNRELNRLLCDSMSLSLLRGSDTISTTLRFVTDIEPMYKIPHRKYALDEGIFYYKLNTWENLEYLYFHNAIENNNNQLIKCIVFDLRNNGGGWENSAAQIASCFISHPRTYCHFSYLYDNNQLIKESWIIQPNINLRLVDIPVVLLVNKHTACASEAFCHFLKQHHETYIISNDEHTPGAYNSPLAISIFDELSLRLVYMKFYVSDGATIEKKGITPDMYVHYKNAFDLAAYHDKLLQTAKKIANHFSNK
jgi:C-terminal processing protease CtpA/Prc